MKNTALLITMIGMATTTTPALAERKESSEVQNDLAYEYLYELNPEVSQKPSDSKNEPENEDNDERQDGFYFPLSIGGQQLNGVDAKTTINEEKYNGSLNRKFGFAGETGIGYKSGDWRFDLQYGYNDLNGDNFSLSGNPSVSNQKSASANLQTLLFGVSYDIKTKSRWTPYVGGTIGAGWLSVGNSSFEVDDVKYKVKGDTASALVYGGKVGLSYKMSRRWDIFAEGAYIRTNSFDLDLKADGMNTEEVTTTSDATTTETETYNGNNEQVAGGGVPCSASYGTTGNNGVLPGPAPATCFDTTQVEVPGTTTTTTVSTEPSVSNLDFGPGNGWSAKIGFRWFFNQKDPAPIEIVEETSLAPEPAQELAPTPVYEAPPQGTPVRALW